MEVTSEKRMMYSKNLSVRLTNVSKSELITSLLTQLIFPKDQEQSYWVDCGRTEKQDLSSKFAIAGLIPVSLAIAWEKDFLKSQSPQLGRWLETIDLPLPQKKVNAQQELELANIEAQTAKVQAEKEKEVAEIQAEQALIQAQAQADALEIAAQAEAEANAKIAASLTPELIEKSGMVRCLLLWPELILLFWLLPNFNPPDS